MSFDLAVWAEKAPLDAAAAEQKYRRLCEGDRSELTPDSRVEAFLADLLGRFPEQVDISDDDVESYPWAAKIDRSSGHVLMSITRPRADDATPVVRDLAASHGLVCYDPQARIAHYPPDLRPDAEPESQLRLQMADGSVVDNADQSTVRDKIGRLSPDNWYAILERAPEWYLQVGFGLNAGAPDGQFALEHRDGGADRHYRAVVADLDEVVEAFVGFAAGEQAWTDRFAWQPLDL